MLDSGISLHPTFPTTDGDEWPMTSPAKTPVPSLSPGQSWPKISIVTPSFNQGAYLEKTIRSVLLQGYPNLEYIIIDGGSTDQSVKIIKKYEPWIDFWVSEKDRGQSHAINKGLSKATGVLLGWLNSDDYFLRGALFKFAYTYLEDPTIGAIYGQGHMVDEKGTIVYTPNLAPVSEESLFGWCFGNDFMQPSCIFTRQALHETGPIDESLNFALDVDFWLRISENFTFKKINDVLSISLAHSKAKTISMRDRSHAELVLICMRHGKEANARRILDQILARHEILKEELKRYQSSSFLWAILNAFRKLKS
jgi:glycosyltransferase involved in cell wall biosynthesis